MIIWLDVAVRIKIRMPFVELKTTVRHITDIPRHWFIIHFYCSKSNCLVLRLRPSQMHKISAFLVISIILWNQKNTFSCRFQKFARYQDASIGAYGRCNKIQGNTRKNTRNVLFEYAGTRTNFKGIKLSREENILLYWQFPLNGSFQAI